MIAHLALGLAAAGLQPADPAECADAASQAEMTGCAAQRFERAEAELDRLYRSLIEAARATDASPDNGRMPGDERPGEEATLREAQQAWTTYRDAHCRGEGYGERGGSMEPMVFEECRARLTRERIAQLRPAPAEGQ